MTAPLHEISDAINVVRRHCEAILKLGEFVADAASAEQAAGEAAERLTAKRDEEAKQDERLAQINSAMAAANAGIEAAKVKANSIVTDAARDAGRRRQDAIAQADKIVADAKVEAENLKGPLNAELTKLRSEVNRLTKRRVELDAATKKSSADLDALNDQITKAREAIANLLKG